MMKDQTVIRRRSKPKPSVAQEFPFQEQDVFEISSALSEPSWLRQRRKQAWEIYSSLPMPTTKDEPWRRTDIRSLPTQSLSLNGTDGTPIENELIEPLASDSHGALIVLQPGESPMIQGQDLLLSQGIVFSSWGRAVQEHPQILEKYLDTVVNAKEGKFAAATAAFANEGFIIYVPEGVHAQVPLHSVLWAPGSEISVFSRVLVVLDSESSLTYVHETSSPTSVNGSAIHSGIVELSVGAGASLKFVEIQNFGDHVWNFTHERAMVARDGKLDWTFGAVGTQLTKNFSEMTLVGPGAEGRMSGFYLADGNQHLDHDTQQNHLAPHTTSDLLFKGGLLDRSRSVWQGMIYVGPGAQNTDGYQANRNIILSEKARADSIPGLEILADDVRCTHGATVSQLEEEPVYYLMSRGLPRKQAERLVVHGFFAPIMERVPFERVRVRFERMIDEKMDRNDF